MIQLKHIGLQVHPDDVMAFYVDILDGHLDGSHKIQADLGVRLFNINQTVHIKYILIGDLTLELFLLDQPGYPSFQHVCVETDHPELIFKSAVERGFTGRSIGSGDKFTYFVKDRVGNVFELKSKLSS